VRILFAPVMIAGYVLGTSMLQLGYQSGSALTTAGVATLLTNALPIAAGTALLGEPLPSGSLRVLRIISFGAVVVGGVLLSRPNVKSPTTTEPPLNRSSPPG
jgi:drug/metabolite transporter (DMT)-like permease